MRPSEPGSGRRGSVTGPADARSGCRREIVITELIWPSGLAVLQAEGPVLYDPRLWQDRPRLCQALADCQGLVVRNQTRVDEDLLEHAPSLRVVGRLGVGLDNLDLPALRARGITVVAGGNASSVAVAEYTLGAMLALARMLPAADASTRAGGWERQRFTGSELHGKTLGLIGLGGVGLLVAHRASAFGMRLLAHDPARAQSDPAVKELGATLVPWMRSCGRATLCRSTCRCWRPRATSSMPAPWR